MSYKSILVHLDASRRCAERLGIASRLALAFGAHLTGVYAAVRRELPDYVRVEGDPELTQQWRKLYRERAELAAGAFHEHTARAGLDSSEMRVAEGDPVQAVALHGRYADLVVLGQTDPDEDPESLGVSRDFPELAVQAVGRPVLLVPYIGSFPRVGERIIVAWNASREAARAATDALPLLQRASQVTVLVVNPGESGDHGEIPGADIALYLARHGVKTEAAHTHTREIDPGSWLVSRACDLGADLIVMGGYSRSYLRELIFGGVTRSLLGQMTVPVLIEH
jgi:nucleotide-binding universal stress UspA family protein